MLERVNYLEHAMVPVFKYVHAFNPEQTIRTMTMLPKILKYQSTRRPKTMEHVELLHKLLVPLADHLMDIRRHVSTQALGRAVWALAYARCDYGPFFEFVREELGKSERLQSCSLRDVSNFTWGLSAMQHDNSHEALMTQLAEVAVPLLDPQDPRALTKLAWAYGFTRVRHPALMDRLAQTLMASMQRPDDSAARAAAAAEAAIEAARGTSVLDKYGLEAELPSAEGPKRVTSKPLKEPDPLGDYRLRNVRWEKQGRATILLLFGRPIKKAHEFWSASSLSTVLWAYARLKMPHPALFQAVAARSSELQREQHVPEFPKKLPLGVDVKRFAKDWSYKRLRRRTLLHMVWACGATRFASPQLLGRLLAAAKMPELTSDELIGTMVVLQKLRYTNTMTYKRIMRALFPVIDKLPYPQLVVLATVCGKVKYHDKPVLERIAETVAARANELSPTQLAQATAALARLRLYDRPLLAAVQAQWKSRSRGFDGPSVARLAMAMKRWPECPMEFKQQLLARVEKELPRIEGRRKLALLRTFPAMQAKLA